MTVTTEDTTADSVSRLSDNITHSAYSVSRLSDNITHSAYSVSRLSDNITHSSYSVSRLSDLLSHYISHGRKILVLPVWVERIVIRMTVQDLLVLSCK